MGGRATTNNPDRNGKGTLTRVLLLRFLFPDAEKIESPTLLIYFNDDIAYHVESIQVLEWELYEAGVDVSLLTVDGPHLGCLQSASE